MKRLIVLGAGGAAGINFCRSVKGDGLHITVVDVCPRRVLLPEADERMVVSRDHCKREQLIRSMLLADVVYAQADSEVKWLSTLRDEVNTLLPSADALTLASDKLRLNQALRDNGVPVPYSEPWERESLGPLFIEPQKVWVRARSGAGSKAALPVMNYQQARAWVDYWCETRGLSPGDFMVCEFLPGPEYAWQGVYHNGELYASAARQRIEYVFAEQMPSGQSSTPSVAAIVHNAALNDIAERAVKAIDATPNGVYGVDCKTDAGGQIKVTEINAGRFYTTSNFYAAAGCNLPKLWAQLAMGHAPEKPGRDPIPEGKTWIRSLDREPLLI